MKTGLTHWLFQRNKHDYKPLCQRTTWHDFAGRMHEALALDMAILLGDVSLADVQDRQKTKPLPAVTLHSDMTIADQSNRWWQYETAIDELRTLVLETV